MTLKTDGGGLAVSANIKVSSTSSASTWNTRLSQIKRVKGEIFICTYSLPDLKYIKQILDKRSTGITILANSKFLEKAIELKFAYPDLKIKLANNTHAKIVLISPETVWLSSANFCHSGWFENTVGIKNKDVYEFYEKEIQYFLSKNKTLEL